MKRLSFNRNQIKYIVIIAMLIDHIGWAFVPTGSVIGQVMHFIGRLTGPTMAYFVAEGYQHTRNVKKYARRLGIFALISWIPYTMLHQASLPIRVVHGTLARTAPAIPAYIASKDMTILFYPTFGVIYTLFLCLLAVWLWDKGRCPIWVKVLGIVGLCALSFFGDWPIFDILITLFVFVFRNDPKSKWISLYVSMGVCVVIMFFSGNTLYQLFQIGMFLPILMMQFCYNGESGSKKKIHKWFFYIFYPAHLLILALIKGGIAL